MEREYFQGIEYRPDTEPLELNEVINMLAYNDQGLIPVITQDVVSNEILMFAWMNKESLYKTIETKRMTYWSRSRQEFWVKGETSGHTQTLESMSFDCDGDTILCKVQQVGAACHTGRRHCFYLDVDTDKQEVIVQKLTAQKP